MSDTVYPYGGTSGHTGSEASQQRAEEMDANGTTASNQARALEVLGLQRSMGLTQAELQRALKVGHGTASSVLSGLHLTGKVERLALKRNRNHIYVLPEHVRERETSPYRRNESLASLRQRISDLTSVLSGLLEEMEPAIASQEPVEHGAGLIALIGPAPYLHTNDECDLCSAYERARRVLDEEVL